MTAKRGQIKLAYYPGGCSLSDVTAGESWTYKPYKIIEATNVVSTALMPGTWLSPDDMKVVMADYDVLIVEGR